MNQNQRNISTSLNGKNVLENGTHKTTVVVHSNKNGGMRVTQGQLEAIAFRFREELKQSLQRAGTEAIATIDKNVLTVRIEQSLSTAEQQLMRRAAGRTFFQHYIEELAEQVYPTFTRHVEQILSCTVTYHSVKVDCESDCIVFTFGLRPQRSWANTVNDMSKVMAGHD